MRRWVASLVLVISAGVAQPADAQTAVDSLLAELDKRPVRVGLLFGRTMARVNFDPRAVADIAINPAARRRPGGQFGLYVMFPFGNHLAVQPELHVTQKGVRYKVEGDPDVPDGFDFELRTAYLEVPVLARVDFGTTERSHLPFVFAGPVFSLRGSCDVALDGQALFIGEKLPMESKVSCDEAGELADDPAHADPIRSYDLGYVAGAGMPARFMGLPLSVQFRYAQGLTNATRTTPAGASAKNNNISFLVTVGF